MCGIAGIISKNTADVTLGHLKNMTDVIAHRGPDGEGHWISSTGQVGLAHRRLSIIDLSHEADQPMHYLGRYSIVFNGEIYNYVELKELLIKQGYSFKTESDTEVLMALYDRDKENCLKLLDGMFSFVLYDDQEKIAFCARDRFGEKPFFYHYKKGEYFYFGSEMKCLWAAGIAKEDNNRMLFNYLAYGFLENPDDLSETFYKNCTRLEHSHSLKINLSTLEIQISRYYDIEWRNIDYGLDINDIKKEFQDLFYSSVKRRLRSDVPVGSSLSGGLDSSLIVTCIDEIKKGTTQKQNTFSAVFPGFKKDERKYIDKIISKTNVEPHFITPKDEDLLNDIEKLCWHQEEPFGSASIYIQYKVMKLAKDNGVTVLLDGQGADEILAGYHSFFVPFFNELKKTNNKNFKFEEAAYKNLHKSNDINVLINKGIKGLIKNNLSENASGLRILYQQFQQLKNTFFNKDFFIAHIKDSFKRKYSFESLNHSLYYNTMNSGLQELLRYADRNSMAHSVEVRLPFLSHELIDFLFKLPSNYKIKEGWTKWILRESSTKLLPEEISWRKDKIGFEPPQKNWMNDKNIIDKIYNKRKALIQKGIISSSNLNKIIVSENAHENINNNWRIFSTSV